MAKKKRTGNECPMCDVQGESNEELLPGELRCPECGGSFSAAQPLEEPEVDVEGLASA